MTTISNLPRDVHGHISKHFNMNDIRNCMEVSKEWNQLFKLDSIWQPIADKHQVKKKIRQFELIQAWLSPNDYMSLVNLKIEKIERKLINRCSCLFREAFAYVFGRNARLQDYPHLVLNTDQRDDIRNKAVGWNIFIYAEDPVIPYLKSKIKAPITIATVENSIIKNTNFLLLRLNNKKTNETYEGVIHFEDKPGDSFLKTQVSVCLKYNSQTMIAKFQELGLTSQGPAGLNKLNQIIQGKTELQLF